MDGQNRQIVIVRLPTDRLTTDCFRLETAPVPTPADGEVLLRPLYITLDASNRAYLQGATYRAGLTAGEVMYGRALAEVTQSRSERLAPGDLVWAETGWRDWAAMPAAGLWKRERREPLSHLLSVYGISGLTAYHGLKDLGRPKPGETVVVSAAGGAVGTLAGQIARLMGARVVGVAGGADKCDWLRRELGYDAMIDHRAGDVRRAMREACPKGIDVYFDNTGGPILEAALFNMAEHGRIVCCGAVSGYDGAGQDPGPRGVPGLIVTKRLTLMGFVVMDFVSQRETALAELRGWVQSGQLKVIEHITDGLETLPAALVGLLAGENRGKRIVRI